MPKLSGQTTVTTAGTEVPLAAAGTAAANGVLHIKALSTNTGIMYVGNDGADAVASTTGYPLSAGESVAMIAGDLSSVMVDASVNGEKVAWLIAQAP